MRSSSATEPGTASSLYRRVWRWHFYAGLVCLPFLVLLAVTGALYLYKDSIESWLYAPLRKVPVAAGPAMAPEALVARALAAQPGTAVRFVAPATPGRSVEVGVRDAQGGVVAVYLDPEDGRLLGSLRDDRRPMEVVRRLHSPAIAGPVANHCSSACRPARRCACRSGRVACTAPCTFRTMFARCVWCTSIATRVRCSPTSVTPTTVPSPRRPNGASASTPAASSAWSTNC